MRTYLGIGAKIIRPAHVKASWGKKKKKNSSMGNLKYKGKSRPTLT